MGCGELALTHGGSGYGWEVKLMGMTSRDGVMWGRAYSRRRRARDIRRAVEGAHARAGSAITTPHAEAVLETA